MMSFSAELSASQDITKLDSLKAIVAKTKPDTLQAKAIYDLGVSLERSNVNESNTAYKLVLTLKGSPRLDYFAGLAAIRLAGNYSVLGKIDSTDYYFKLAEVFHLQNLDNDRFTYNYLTGLSIHYNRLGNTAEALHLYRQITELDPDQIGRDNVAGSYINISNVYARLNDLDKRTEALYQALEIFDDTQNLTGLAFATNGLGSVAYANNQYEKARTFFLQSLEYRRQLKDLRGEAVLLGNLGNVYMSTGDYEEAERTFLAALEMTRTIGNNEVIGNHLFNLGKNAAYQNQHNIALDYFAQAKEAYEAVNISTFDAALYTDFGKSYSALGKYTEAIAYLEQAATIAEPKRDFKELVSAYKALQKLHHERGDFQQAYNAQTLVSTYTDSVGFYETQAKIQQMESQYQLNKKDTEISLLLTEKDLNLATLARQRANKNLFAVLLTFFVILAAIIFNRSRVVARTRRQLELERLRNSIARDLHDDLGSTLSSIQIISQMELLRQGQGHNVLAKINTHTTEMLDKLGDIVWSISPINDSLEQLISKMKEFAVEILEPKGTDYSIDFPEEINGIALNPEQRRNLFFIFKEAVNNAAKYSQASKVEIELNIAGGTLALVIKDDGQGFELSSFRKGNGLTKT